MRGGIVINSSNVAPGDNETTTNATVIKCKYSENVCHSSCICVVCQQLGPHSRTTTNPNSPHLLLSMSAQFQLFLGGMDSRTQEGVVPRLFDYPPRTNEILCLSCSAIHLVNHSGMFQLFMFISVCFPGIFLHFPGAPVPLSAKTVPRKAVVGTSTCRIPLPFTSRINV